MGKILFIRGGAVGDFILTLPAIQLVRQHLPTAGIEVLGYTPITRLAQAARLVDATRSIEYGPLSSFFVPGSTLPKELVDYFAGFSVVFSYLYDPDDYFAENLCRSGVKTLFAGPHRIDESLADQSAARQLAKPLEQLALYLEDPFVHLSFDDASVVEANAFLDTTPSGAEIQRIAIHPGSGSPRKNWSFEGWVNVALQLYSDDPTLRFLITAGEAEERVIGEFVALLDAAGVPYDLASQLPLPVLGSLLQRCRLYLGHDSGISHLAAACGVPSVLLFGKTDPAIWAPQNPKVSVIRAPEGDLSQIDSKVVTVAASQRLAEGSDPETFSPA